jgi:hypothetical protein
VFLRYFVFMSGVFLVLWITSFIHGFVAFRDCSEFQTWALRLCCLNPIGLAAKQHVSYLIIRQSRGARRFDRYD